MGVHYIPVPRTEVQRTDVSRTSTAVQINTSDYETIDIIDLRHFKEPISSFMKDKKYDEVLIMYSFDNLSSDINIRRLKF